VSEGLQYHMKQTQSSVRGDAAFGISIPKTSF